MLGQKCASSIQSKLKKFQISLMLLIFSKSESPSQKIASLQQGLFWWGLIPWTGGFGHLEHFSFWALLFQYFFLLNFFELAPLLSFSMRVDTLNGRRRTPWAPGFLRHCGLQQKSVKKNLHVYTYILVYNINYFILVEVKKRNWVKKIFWQLLWWSSRWWGNNGLWISTPIST